MTNPMVPTISTNDVINGDLPDGITGVHWVDTGWVECIEHLNDPSWAMAVEKSDAKTGEALFGDVPCDAHREAASE